MSSLSDGRDTIRQRLNSMIAPESITEIPDDATVEVRGEDGVTYGNISYADFAEKVGDCVHDNLTTLDSTTAAFTTAQETKLSGIATSATANSTNATLLARGNHTGTQAASTISDFDTEVANNSTVSAHTTKLSGYPANCVVITGTTGAINTTVSYSTGTTKAKISGFTIQVSDSDASWIPQCFGTAGTDSQYYKAYINSSGTLKVNVLTESTDVQLCGFTAIIFYGD